MNVSIEIRSEVIEKQLLGFKYKETDGDNLYYNYLGLGRRLAADARQRMCYGQCLHGGRASMEL